MEVTLDSKLLKRALGLLERVVPARPANLLYTHIGLRVGEEEGLLLYASDGETDLEVRLKEAEVRGEGNERRLARPRITRPLADPRTWGTNTWSGREKPSLTLSHPFLKRVVKIPLGPRGLPSRGATHILKAGERRLPRAPRKAAPWLAKAHTSAPRPLTRRGT
jgi:hypothetical protein